MHPATPTPTTASAHAQSMRGASSSPPSASDILSQTSAFERTINEAPEGSVPAAALRPFLAAVRAHLAQIIPLIRVEAKLDKLSAILTRTLPTSYA